MRECVLWNSGPPNIFYGFIIWNERTRTGFPLSLGKMGIALIAIPIDNGGDDEHEGLNEPKCDSIWSLAGPRMRDSFSVQRAKPFDIVTRTIYSPIVRTEAGGGGRQGRESANKIDK